MCTIGGKMYWVRKNLKHEEKTLLGNEPIVLDLLKNDDDRICLQFDKTFCFSRSEDALDPESKMKLITQELKKLESEARKKRVEQERLKTLSEHYEQLEKQYNDWGLPAPNQNLFIDLMQEIATELGLSNCWICSGLKLAEKWPWKGGSLTLEQLLKWDSTQISKTIQRPEGWILDKKIIGTICISHESKDFNEFVGYTPCISTLTVNSNNKSKIWQPEPPTGFWSSERDNNCEWINLIGLCWHKSSGVNPYQSLEGLRDYWREPERINMKWKAPDGIYWVCRKKAYSELPKKWKGSCTLGMIRPFFFTLPRSESNLLGAPLYETLERQKREIKKELPMAGESQK